MKNTCRLAAAALLLLLPGAARAETHAAGNSEPRRFTPPDVFQLEYASDPQISPDGSRVVYVRNFMDVMTDRRRSNLWIVGADGTDPRPLTTGSGNDASPRWSPDGKRLLYTSSADGSTQLWLRWMDSGQTARLTQLTGSPGGIAWSPDGKRLAFSMRVAERPEPFAEMPPAPEGAEWAEAPRVIRRLNYRFDGRGYVGDGYTHLFVLPAEGGTPRQLTHGKFNHGARPSWTPDGRALVFSANREADWEYDPQDTEVYRVDVATGTITALTDRQGPDNGPVVSPDGRHVAYLGYDDRYQGYQVTRLHVMNVDGTNPRVVTGGLDRRVRGPVWDRDGRGLYVAFDDAGNTRIAHVTLQGKVQRLARDVGGTSIGRPYASGSFSVARDGAIAFTHTRPGHPADVAVLPRDGREGEVRRVTRLNDDLLAHKQLAEVSEIRFRSSFDDREIQGWIALPPGFDPQTKYPLLLEIHGGPFANYGDRFSAEVQLYASAGYVVLYVNPRGSTSYGEEFGNLIHHNYPGQDYDDLMSGVDAVLARGFIDPERLFVTGGSGGGVLTAWIVGKTGRFRAAVVAKPVINWTSFVLTADAYNFFYRYWFPGFPWDHADHYMARSPLSLVGNVTTPTMLLTGEEDYRTPMSESEQYYQALKLRKIDTALVRIPGASHGIANRPSQLIAKAVHILEWFRRHDVAASASPGGEGR
jgi:acylaminoacyl-peptidase